VSLALQYGRAAASLQLADVPAGAREVARAGIADTVGTLLAGRHEQAVEVLMRASRPFAPGRARLLLSAETASPGDAALVNGTAAHVLDFDDVALHAHPSTVLVPAILALGEELGASGADAVLAYVVGYEVWADLAHREAGLHHEKGWHPTGVIGAVAAAAACARLLGAAPEAFANALCTAASMSAGLTVNFGSMTKSLHAGRAAQSGIAAARLGLAGFTARPDALEHARGLLSALSPTGAPDLASPSQVGTRWCLLEDGLNIKRYPTCYCTHRSIDAMLQLRDEGKAAAGDIEAIEVLISEEHNRVLLNHRPTTSLQAKFSLEFAMAAACVAGAVGLTELDDAFVQRADVQALLQRVKPVFATEKSPGNAAAALYDQVTVHLRDGTRTTSTPVVQAQGHAQRPLSRAQRQAKFADCLAFGRAAGDAGALFAVIDDLESLADLRTLAAPS
jgi:2-methylcitrate dehydratase PrpD